MNGIELSKQYWEKVGRPAIELECPQILEHAAVGLVGEGSECFGYDDELSRDHDWGPGFCMWFTKEDYEIWGERAEDIYNRLPQEYCGFRRLHQVSMSAGRVGVLELGSFYQRFLGIDREPQTIAEWFVLPESGLATATNGEVFSDPVGEFSAMRQALLNYYPEDVRLKKLAAHCALAAQSGQYNYPRCMQRGDAVAAALALGQFIEHIQAIIFLLNRRYRPYYKWTHRSMALLPKLGKELAPMIEALVGNTMDKTGQIEQICQIVIQALRLSALSDSSSDFLLSHAEFVQSGIQNIHLRNMHLMAK